MKDLAVVFTSSFLILLSLIFAKQEKVSLVNIFECYERVKASQLEAYEINKARKTTEEYEKYNVNLKHD